MKTKKMIIIGLLLVIITLLLVGIAREQRTTMERTAISFGECVARGYEVLESLPRQCVTPDGTVFTEEMTDINPQEWNGDTPLIPATRTESQARVLAQSVASCADIGSIGLLEQYNPINATWWFTLEPSEENLMCDPACVVHDATGEVEVNWRCRGLLPPPAEEVPTETIPEWVDGGDEEAYDEVESSL
jgi:hypothetical protein